MGEEGCALRQWEKWDANYDAVLEFAKARGNLNFSRDNPKERRLMGWLIQQGRKVTLSNYRKEKLKVLEQYKGLHSHDEKWYRMYERLVAYYDVNHHFVVSRKEDSQLLSWIQEQRSQAKNKTLKQHRQEKLDAIDFPFIIYKSNENLGLTNNQQTKWNDMYTQLLSFQKLFGHCKVPLNYNVNPALGRWVRKQRHGYVTGVLDDKRRVRLEQIDFSWVARQKKVEPPGKIPFASLFSSEPGKMNSTMTINTPRPSSIEDTSKTTMAPSDSETPAPAVPYVCPFCAHCRSKF